MGGDDLSLILEVMRAELPGVPAEAWDRVERAIRETHGGRDSYIARRVKRDRLAEIEAAMRADESITAAELSQRLGLSVRRVQQLKRLCRRG